LISRHNASPFPPLPLFLLDLQHLSIVFSGSFKSTKHGLLLSELGSGELMTVKVKVQTGIRQSGLNF